MGRAQTAPKPRDARAAARGGEIARADVAGSRVPCYARRSLRERHSAALADADTTFCRAGIPNPARSEAPAELRQTLSGARATPLCVAES